MRPIAYVWLWPTLLLSVVYLPCSNGRQRHGERKAAICWTHAAGQGRRADTESPRRVVQLQPKVSSSLPNHLACFRTRHCTPRLDGGDYTHAHACVVCDLGAWPQRCGVGWAMDVGRWRRRNHTVTQTGVDSLVPWGRWLEWSVVRAFQEAFRANDNDWSTTARQLITCRRSTYMRHIYMY